MSKNKNIIDHVTGHDDIAGEIVEPYIRLGRVMEILDEQIADVEQYIGNDNSKLPQELLNAMYGMAMAIKDLIREEAFGDTVD